MTARGHWEDIKKRVTYAFGYFKAPILTMLWTGQPARSALFIGRSPRVVNRGQIVIGRRFRMRSVIARSSVEVAPSAILSIGEDVFINQGFVLYAGTAVTIGDRVDIGDGVRIYDTNFHPTRPGETTRQAPVTIEPDVWLASGVTVLPGVTIGRGSVVAAGAVVTKTVPAGSVVATAPGQVIGSFDVPIDYRRRVLD